MTLWAVAHQAPLSMGFSRQEYWSGLSFLPPGNHLVPGIEPTSLKPRTSAGRFFTTSGTWKASIPSYHVPSHLLLSMCNTDAGLFILMGVCMCVYLCVCGMQSWGVGREWSVKSTLLVASWTSRQPHLVGFLCSPLPTLKVPHAKLLPLYPTLCDPLN